MKFFHMKISQISKISYMKISHIKYINWKFHNNDILQIIKISDIKYTN